MDQINNNRKAKLKTYRSLLNLENNMDEINLVLETVKKELHQNSSTAIGYIHEINVEKGMDKVDTPSINNLEVNMHRLKVAMSKHKHDKLDPKDMKQIR